MYYVWVNGMKVAGADTLAAALYYGSQYREEGRVTIKDGNKIVSVMSEKAP